MMVSQGNVVVTGATRGIGRATVDAILERGGKVVAIARNERLLAALQASAPNRIRALTADLEDLDRISELARLANDAFGSVDGLVNCAGIARYEPVGAIGLDAIEAQLRVNLAAPLLLSQALAVHLRAPGGSIVNVSSTLSERAAPQTVVYAATKAALNAVTKGLALELAPAGVRVNAVLPGGVETDMLRTPRLLPGETLGPGEIEARVASQLADLTALHPLGRLGTPEEVAAVIISVLDQTWQTGSLVTIDGGLSLA
ncbi:MAG: SDR family oxidoreductase [Myxococcales bacterium]|nr:SDR family oxidoreductase [Deltaproteobacteria bacterium]NNE19782.1 SDR family oxidoreductase [Myxococcales bacterium]